MSSQLAIIMAMFSTSVLPALLKYTVAVKNKGELCVLWREKKQMQNGTYDITLSGRKRFRETEKQNLKEYI